MKHIVFQVPEEKITSYATLLQFGILLEYHVGQAIGIFISDLPGIDIDYITDRIQTIFLDGNAVDDMETPFKATSRTLALSAAMPGLAGAIFRKNSMHAALRTIESKNASAVRTNEKSLVCLKLFNTVAGEKGPGILAKGGVFPGSTLIDFFELRSQLKQDIIHIKVEYNEVNSEAFWPILDPSQKYHVIIESKKSNRCHEELTQNIS